MPNPSITQLKRALEISEKIQKLEAKLASILGSSPSQPSKARAGAEPKAAKKRKKTKMSPQGLANIIAAQKKRWAKVKKEKKAAV